MLIKIEEYKKGKIFKEKIIEVFQGWNAYAKWANTYNIGRKIFNYMNNIYIP